MSLVCGSCCYFRKYSCFKTKTRNYHHSPFSSERCHYHQKPRAPPPSSAHLHQLLFLLGERPREFSHGLQVALGAGGFQGPEIQLLSVSFEQVGGAADRHLMELRGD